MDYEAARMVGDSAELKVAATLSKLESEYGFRVLHDVLVARETPRGLVTAQLDHVLVDQIGILVLETKARRGAMLRGTFADRRWTACYPGGRNEPFQNPLQQNDQHLVVLRQAMADAGHEIPLDRVRGLVVFVGADTSRLELDSISAARVSEISELPDRMAVRHNFMSQHPLSPDDQSALVKIVTEVDRSADPKVIEAHANHRAGVDGGRTRAKQPSRATEAPRTSRLVKLLVLLAAILAAAWAAAAFLGDSAKLFLLLLLIVSLSALGGNERTRRRRRRSSAPLRTTPPAPAASLGRRLVASLMSVLLTLALIGGLLIGMNWWLRSMSKPLSGDSTASSPYSAVGGSAAAPIGLLYESFPDLQGRIVNVNEPIVVSTPMGTTYTWEYWASQGGVSVEKRVSLTVDGSGNLVGVER